MPSYSAFPCSAPAELIFLVDGSYSIDSEDWVKATRFVSYVIHNIDVAQDGVRVGVIVYGSGIYSTMELTPFTGMYRVLVLGVIGVLGVLVVLTG